MSFSAGLAPCSPRQFEPGRYRSEIVGLVRRNAVPQLLRTRVRVALNLVAAELVSLHSKNLLLDSHNGAIFVAGFEQATHIPFMLSAPGVAPAVSHALVEAVDLMRGT